MKDARAAKSAIEEVFLGHGYRLRDGVLCAPDLGDGDVRTEHNADAFSEKWQKVVEIDSTAGLEGFQKDWYLRLYGFSDEAQLREFLSDKQLILDAGAGYGYKSAYFASLSPESLIVCMDLSDSVFLAAGKYRQLPNIVFVKGDIARTGLASGSVDFVNCDQVLHHTISPEATLGEFARVLKVGGRAALYVYARKALPRELLDEHFISGRANMGRAALWNMSERLTALGKALEETGVELDVPDIPELGIKGGRQNLQRFIYYNFVKCFWNADMGSEASTSTNFDWYAPSIAYRFTREEFDAMTRDAGFQCAFSHSEEACHSGLYAKATDQCR